MRLLRYQIFLAYVVALASIWYAALIQKSSLVSFASALVPSTIILPFSLSPEVVSSAQIDYAPLWALFGFGLYAVFSIGYGIAMLADSPDAADELERQLKEAKVELKKRGIISS